jgi:putative nucleotidyltransferase with HDIG domain
MGALAASSAKSVSHPEILLALESLPPFPSVAVKAMNMLSGTETSLGELCDLVRLDAVFTGELLRIANSPLIAFSKEVTSVLQASMLLGFRRLRRIVITVGMRSYMAESFTPALQACWRHSVACAMLAERTARWNSVDRDFAYTAGILHDIGRVALATISPQVYDALVERASSDPAWDALQNEREAFGIDHCHAGQIMLSAWKLPEEFVEATCGHHEPLTCEENAAEVIRLCCRLADGLGFAAMPRRSSQTCEEILGEFPEDVRKHFPSIEELTAEIAKEISVVEAG